MKQQQYKVSILGATGYTGFELVKLILKHPRMELAHITSESTPGKPYSSMYPALKGRCDLALSENSVELVARDSDAVFLCLPHGASMDAAAQLEKMGVMVFDLSADYRIKDPKLYEQAYKQEHRYLELLSNAVYGLAEINTAEIAEAKLVAVPGCYPTSILIPLIPLLREGLVDASILFADSKSGVSGAGKNPTATTHFCEANEDFKPYGIFTHRHKPEIDHVLRSTAGVKTDIVFTPHLAPFNRGMLSTIYTRSNKDVEVLLNAWRKAYNSHEAVRICDDGTIPSVKYVANTPYVDIALYKNGENLVVVSALDNLLKGASAQAMQCFNIRFGFNENEGLI